MLLSTGFESIMSHYASFLDKGVLETLQRKGVFRILEAIEELPGLWISIGGMVSARFGQVILGERIAAKIQQRPPPARILEGPLAFALVGPDPFMVQIPKRTILINALAALTLLAFGI